METPADFKAVDESSLHPPVQFCTSLNVYSDMKMTFLRAATALWSCIKVRAKNTISSLTVS